MAPVTWSDCGLRYPVTLSDALMSRCESFGASGIDYQIVGLGYGGRAAWSGDLALLSDCVSGFGVG